MGTFFAPNCSEQEDFPFNLSEYSINETFYGEAKENLVESGTLTSVSTVLFINILLSIQFSKYGSWPLKNGPKTICKVETFSRTLVLTILVLILPVVTVFLLFVSLYKVLCFQIIKRQDKHFAGFLDSFDVFWCLEDDTAKSIINVLGVIESKSPYIIANSMKTKLWEIFPREDTEKIFYRRKEDYGFYYWTKFSSIDMDQYVEVIDFSNEYSNTHDIENLMTEVQNQDLPYNDEGLFKILITRHRISNFDQETGHYAIIFRIHHSVGDGVALIEFLCQTFADKNNYGDVKLFSMPKQSSEIDTPSTIIDMMQKLCQIPICFADGILRKADNNTLHGQHLTGKKIFKWTNSDENLLVKIKEIKGNVEDLKFTDVLLAALSNGLKKFFSETKASVPDDLAVIIPIRFPKSTATECNLIMTNDFSVTIINLPVEGRENLNEVNIRCKELRKSADPLTNYYFLKLVTSILPKSVLQPMLNSSQATMVFSSLPGPSQLTICGGNDLKLLVFFVPNKGNTGLGVTALCYGNVLRLAAMADAAILPNPEDLSLILQGMVDEIHQLHERHVRK